MKNRTVVVTGSSSGIGRATALHLAQSGWRVFAGVRRAADAPVDPGVTPLILDVAEPASVQQAAEAVRAQVGEAGLDALVNNAGIGQAFPMEYVSQEELQKIFSVNVFGLISVTQAFLPLLRVARGRIVNIGSIGGLITVPFGGALCATKRAVEAISDSLRLELRPAGIHVVVVRPASIHTPAADRLVVDTQALLEKLPPEGRERYGASLLHFLEEMQKSENSGSPPEVVAETVRTALEAKDPHTSYLSGKGAQVLGFVSRWIPDELKDRLLLSQLGLPHAFGQEAHA